MADQILLHGVAIDANDYQAQAGAYAAACRSTGEKEADEEARGMRANHAAAGRYYWAAAYAALDRRDWDSMRAHAAQAKAADEIASPNGVLLAAIFGGCERVAEERAVAQGRDLPADLVAQARKAVQAEMARHRATKRKPARPAAPVRAAYTGHLPAVGAVVRVMVSVKLAATLPGFAWVPAADGDGTVTIYCPGVTDGTFVRIVSHDERRVGKNVAEAQGVLA